MSEFAKSSNLEKITIKISGMSCSSCELKIENVLSKLDGIKKVKVSFTGKNAIITFDKDKININEIKEKITGMGYEVSDVEPERNKNFSYFKLAGIASIIIVVWLILGKTGVFNSLPQINNTMGFGILFVVGLLTSIHCIAMCGGINLSQSIRKDEVTCVNEMNPDNYKKFIPGILYNTGRVISYTVIGGIVGTIGSVINLSGKTQGLVVIIAGFFMILMSINLMGIFPWLSKITPRIPKFIAIPLMSLKAGNKGPFVVGLLNGLMPCGPLQSMQLYALGTGGFIAGATSMFLFSLGTVPLMLGIGALSTFFTHKFSNRLIKISAMLIFFLGIGMIGRGFNLSGLNLSGIIPIGDNTAKNFRNVAVLKDGIQYVESGINDSGYEPIIVQKGMPVIWTIKADSSSLNGCNNAIVIPSLKIEKKLKAGDNIVEFTPNDVNNISFTCWMGMITSNIKVVDNINTVTGNDIAQIKNESKNIETVTNEKSNNISIGSKNIATLKSGKQYVESNVTSSGYEPIIVQKGIPVKWTMKADGSSLTGCNNSIKISKYNITKKLNPGNNVIEFVPDSTGIVPFTCWMGMTSSSIKVVDDVTRVSKEEIAELNMLSANSSGGCCSAGVNSISASFNPVDYFTASNMGKAVITNGIQYVTVDVNDRGYVPKITVMQKGIKTKWIFNGKTLNDANYRMIVPVYNARIEFYKGENSIDFLPVADFGFDSWKGDYHGFIAVVDNIRTYTDDEIKTKIDNYIPFDAASQQGSGGCCGK